MSDANYRKHNDGSHNSTYHKKDGTPTRQILKREAEQEIEDDDEVIFGSEDVCPAWGEALIALLGPVEVLHLSLMKPRERRKRLQEHLKKYQARGPVGKGIGL